MKPNSVIVLLSFQNISHFLKSLPRSRLSRSKHLSGPRYNETVFFVVADTGTPQKPGEIHRLLNQYIIVMVVHCMHCLLSLVKVSRVACKVGIPERPPPVSWEKLLRMFVL